MTTTKRYVDFSGTLEILSLAQASEIINKLYSDWNITRDKSLWFRGQGGFDWQLLPGLYRPGISSSFEREAIRDFKLHSPRYLHDTPKTEIGWISIMQHYGLPTRLLDWSESFMTALFFAVQDIDIDEDAAIWVIRPVYLNREILGDHSLIIESDERLRKYVLPDPKEKIRVVEAKLPAAFRSEWNNIRIAAQKGVFTIHGYDRRPLEDIIIEYNSLGKDMQAVKIRIPKSKKEQLLWELRIAGVTDLLLFPEIDGLCKEIKRRYLK